MTKTNVNKSISEINERIKRGDAVVVTAEEMTDIVEEKGEVKAAKEIDVVTTGTFGAMCSSGAWLNFGHSDPPIKLNRAWLNDVEAYTSGAAVDAYIGATELSETERMEYGGAHVIEDIIEGKEIELRGTAYGTDCYPRKEIETTLTKNDLNQAVLCNPRNAYQTYNAATNSRNETIHTYMGTLLPEFGNVTFSGAGELNPLTNDPNYETIGPGTRIFLGGAKGHIFWEGTQHNPKEGFGTIMTVGDLKEMSSEYIRGVTVRNYGVSLFVGVGIPIPVINEGVARSTGVSDEDITTNIVDYGIPRRDKPKIREVTYKELKSGQVNIKGDDKPVSPLSSLKKAKEISKVLKDWIKNEKFLLSEPIESLSRDRDFKPMKQTSAPPIAKDLMTANVVTVRPEDSIESAAKVFAEKGFDHLPVVNEENKLVGIVTSWDVAVALGKGREKISEILTSKVITALEDEPADSIAQKLQKHNISGVPVVNSKKQVRGIVTSEDLSQLIGGR
ncbi:hypothetical protein AKJ50_02130 [candidate division MSBL1 archaeon SCGC-AAA382A13]|uniref:CBS domain-containing protein n=2 Tax=candidate division MSBL1 TaxID=215777 RepID=A0A133VFP8_9EURY|nr:hypothetical protein AKJ50_02130 [candidate division MSBL1 archaeon SCGC-AAA382A13]KXB05259.1 hypothetical protein AKJ49_01160 [candidate division MSBL1 archaeon SCGC-AAA382A03]